MRGRASAAVLAMSLLGCTPKVAAGPQGTGADAVAWVGPKTLWLWDSAGFQRLSLRAEDPTWALDLLRERRSESGDARDPADGNAVIGGDDDARLLDVLAIVGGLFESCERPVRVRLSPSAEPTPLLPVTFHGCYAVEPVRYCSSLRLEVFTDQIEVHHVAEFLGDDCPHGAHALRRVGAPPPPRRPEPDVRPFAREASVSDMLLARGEQAELPACADASVRFHGYATAWGDARTVLADVDRVSGARIVLDVAPDPATELPGDPVTKPSPLARE